MNYNPGSDSTKTLKQRHARTVTRMKSLADLMDQRKLTPAERDEFASLKRQSDEIYHAIKTRKLAKRGGSSKRGIPEIQGTPNEALVPGQSMTEWVRRAAENGVTIQRNKD